MNPKIRRQFAARRREAEIKAIREAAHPIEDRALLDFIHLYEQTIGQLDEIANVVQAQSVTVDMSTGKATENSEPCFQGEELRAQIRRIMEL